jgi:MFS family permease
MTYIIEGCIEDWNESTFNISISASMLQIGMLIGNLLWGILSDKFGRKVCFKASGLVNAVGSLMLVFSFNIYFLSLSLFIIGTAMAGELILANVFFCEFCPPSKRYLMTLLSLFFSFGSITTALVAYLTALLNSSGVSNWRIIVAFGAFVQVSLMFFRSRIRETPVFLTTQGKIRESEEVLDVISRANQKIGFEYCKLEGFNEKEQEIDDDDKKNEKWSAKRTFHVLFGKDLLKITVVWSVVREN